VPTCNHHHGWLPKVAATFLTESIRVFGVPREPITFDDATIPMEMQMRRGEIFPSKGRNYYRRN
jgi:hypothetical protein